ncbi:MAG: hypothetical protein RBT69_11100 [Spirochaetia bacterium]|jgi:outer membrane murein-binding lipoprotein Lpp|nr:hypothetical protein [Spirochaetia bacterium]
MKKIILLLTVLAVILMIFFLAGCAQEDTMSIKDRIGEFVSDLNSSNRDSIFKDNFHSDSDVHDTGGRDTINAAFPPEEKPYSSSISGSGLTRTVSITASGDGTTTGDYTFTMREEDSDDWYILRITVPGGLDLK